MKTRTASECVAPSVITVVLLILLTTVSLWGITGNEFIDLDDPLYITGNPVVRQGLTASGIGWAFTTKTAANWHPLTWISHMFDVQLFGLNPAAHHAMSLALHVANVLLLFALLRSLTGAHWRSTLVAALFAVHPLHVESVAWAAERKDVLSLFLALLAALAYVRTIRRSGSGSSVLAASLFAAALMAKPMPVSLPFLLLLLDWWPLGRWSPALDSRPSSPLALARSSPPARLWVEKIPLFALAAASSAVTTYAQHQSHAVKTIEEISLSTRIVNAAFSYVVYLIKMAWPHHLSVYYTYPRILTSWWLWAGALALLCVASYGVLRVSRSRPYLAVGWFWYLGTMIPMVGLIQVGAQGMADRYTYFPLVGLFLLASWAAGNIAETYPWSRVPLAAAAAAAVIALSSVAMVQVRYWRDDATLFARALELDSENLAAHYTLAGVLARQGKAAEALFHYRASLRLNPNDATFVAGIGDAAERLGDPKTAIAAYRQALLLKPTYREALNNLGCLLADEGEFQEAESSFRTLVQLDPRNAMAYTNLGNVLFRGDRTAEAAEAYRKALALSPGLPAATRGLAALITRHSAPIGPPRR